MRKIKPKPAIGCISSHLHARATLWFATLPLRSTYPDPDIFHIQYQYRFRPKGVRLSHANLLYQVMKFPSFLEIAPGQRTLSILPPWHVYERVCAYYILSCGACQVITNIKHLKQDLSLYRPNHFVCVPLVLETLRSRVLATLRMSSPVRRILALNLLAISIIFLRHKRVLQGIDLRFAKKPPSIWQLFRSWVMSCFLAPLKLLFNVLVASKIRNAIGVQDVIVCGGGSLGVHLDDFYEGKSLKSENTWT